ncbi:unnamed protein product [Oppiella nova]|uniref:Uncharacterized protein n=1 Tax=Oppiella nova TaxID=334625 RepID=A0A7R9QDM9_9ACAR|nr:unnamed protein product [Oppiella nova]CAG2163747.1 unnamed protein product [Oppiella nova]
MVDIRISIIVDKKRSCGKLFAGDPCAPNMYCCDEYIICDGVRAGITESRSCGKLFAGDPCAPNICGRRLYSCSTGCDSVVDLRPDQSYHSDGALIPIHTDKVLPNS